MTTETGPLLPTQPSRLLERWRHESVASVWRRPSDWYHRAVDELAVALLLDDDPVPPAARLGGARAEAGVGIAETIDDLACLYRTTSAPEPPLEVLRALCTGWADVQAGGVTLPLGLDAGSGLPSADYLRLRLMECYPDDVPTGRLLVVDVAAGVPDALSRLARSAAVGAALREVFGAARAMASIGGGAFVVLVGDDERTDDAVAHLRRRVDERVVALRVEGVTRRPVRCWVEPLPPTHECAVRRLAQLARP